MPIPAANCACDIDADVCCDTTWLVGDRIRTVAWNAIRECGEHSCCDREFRSHTSVGPTIQDPLGDSLIVHMTNLGLAPRRQANIPMISAHVAEYRLELRENGWPTIGTNLEGSIISVPSSEQLNFASKHLQGHAEKMYRALVDGIQRLTLFPVSVNPHLIQPNGINLFGFGPIQPTAYIAGYSCTVTVMMKL